MATTWGGVTIPDPTTWTQGNLHLGGQRRMADGSLQSDSLATKDTFTIRWELITKAQRDLIYTEFIETSGQVFNFAGVESFTVIGIFDSWNATPVGITPAWNVSCTVEEA